jgi:hypothetical protein
MTRARMPHGAWPRGLNLKLVAAYRGVCPNTFLAEVKAGLMPEPETRGRRKIWDRFAVDKRMDRLDEPEGDPLMEALDDSEA